MLQTALRVVESPSPLLVIVSLSSARQDRQDRVYPRTVRAENISELIPAARKIEFESCK